MKQPKFINDHDSQQYKLQLAEFMQQINPKDAAEALEKLKQKYLDARENR